MQLNEIRDNKTSSRKSKRLGRGEGSGKGKTCGRGHKGQKARSGVAIKGFEGGQNPLYMRLPKRGFKNTLFKQRYAITSLDKIWLAIQNKTIDSSKKITIDILKQANLIKSKSKKIKLLANNSKLEVSLHILVDKASAAAVKAVEEANGTIKQLST